MPPKCLRCNSESHYEKDCTAPAAAAPAPAAGAWKPSSASKVNVDKKCLRCGSTDHWEKDCTAPAAAAPAPAAGAWKPGASKVDKKCLRCGSTDHWEKDCTAPAAAAPAPAPNAWKPSSTAASSRSVAFDRAGGRGAYQPPDSRRGDVYPSSSSDDAEEEVNGPLALRPARAVCLTVGDSGQVDAREIDEAMAEDAERYETLEAERLAAPLAESEALLLSELDGTPAERPKNGEACVECAKEAAESGSNVRPPVAHVDCCHKLCREHCIQRQLRSLLVFQTTDDAGNVIRFPLPDVLAGLEEHNATATSAAFTRASDILSAVRHDAADTFDKLIRPVLSHPQASRRRAVEGQTASREALRIKALSTPPELDPIPVDLPQCGCDLHDLRSFFTSVVYGHTPPASFDAFGHLQASDPFIACGDAIVLEIISRIGAQILHGGQSLLFTYCFEKFLNEFVLRGARQIHLVWFESVEILMPPLARMFCAVAQHFFGGAHIEHIHQADTFSSPDSEEFAAYLSTVRPSFILSHDGELPYNRLPWLFPPGRTSRALTHSLRAILVECMSRRHRVAYTASMSIRGSRIHVFVHVWSWSLAEACRRHKPAAHAAVRDRIRERLSSKVYPAPFATEETAGVLARLPCPEFPAVCLAASALALAFKRQVSAGVALNTADVGAARSILLAVGLQQSLPLRSRSFQLEEPDQSSELFKLIPIFQEALFGLLSSNGLADALAIDGPRGAPRRTFMKMLADIFDGRLAFMAAKLESKVTELGLSAQLLAALEQAWKYVQCETAISASLVASGTVDSNFRPQHSEARDFSVMVLHHGLAEDTCSSIEHLNVRDDEEAAEELFETLQARFDSVSSSAGLMVEDEGADVLRWKATANLDWIESVCVWHHLQEVKLRKMKIKVNSMAEQSQEDKEAKIYARRTLIRMENSAATAKRTAFKHINILADTLVDAAFLSRPGNIITRTVDPAKVAAPVVKAAVAAPTVTASSGLAAVPPPAVRFSTSTRGHLSLASEMYFARRADAVLEQADPSKIMPGVVEKDKVADGKPPTASQALQRAIHRQSHYMKAFARSCAISGASAEDLEAHRAADIATQLPTTLQMEGVKGIRAVGHIIPPDDIFQRNFLLPAIRRALPSASEDATPSGFSGILSPAFASAVGALGMTPSATDKFMSACRHEDKDKNANWQKIDCAVENAARQISLFIATSVTAGQSLDDADAVASSIARVTMAHWVTQLKPSCRKAGEAMVKKFMKLSHVPGTDIDTMYTKAAEQAKEIYVTLQKHLATPAHPLAKARLSVLDESLAVYADLHQAATKDCLPDVQETRTQILKANFEFSDVLVAFSAEDIAAHFVTFAAAVERGSSKSAAKQKPVKVKREDEVRRQTEERAEKAALEKESRQWANTKDASASDRTFLIKIAQEFVRKGTIRHPVVVAQVMFDLLGLLRDAWMIESEIPHEDRDYKIAGDIFEIVHSTISRFAVTGEHRNILTKAQKLAILDALVYIGLPDNAAKSAPLLGLSASDVPPDNRPAMLAVKTSVGPSTSSFIRFQLTHMHYRLKRPKGVKDPLGRIEGFTPDPWQLDLINIVDRRESALICAPTSSGKTFIAQYCMKVALHTSDEDVVVYVTPSLALTNQVLSNLVYNFGSKDYHGLTQRDNAGPSRSDSTQTAYYKATMVMSGVLQFSPLNSISGMTAWTKDVFNCQILVADVQGFERLLLSPQYADTWAKRLRYVIFDEVHCLSADEKLGSVWERLLLSIRCPFVALSATVGNPQDMFQWLQRVQALVHESQPQYSGRVNFVHHAHRWSDLQKFVFVPGPSDRNTPLRVHSADGMAKPEKPPGSVLSLIPPVAALATNRLALGWPSDLSMTPLEALRLYDQLLAHAKTHNLTDIVERLTSVQIDPDLRFNDPSRRYINEEITDLNQAQARAWEVLMREEMCHLAQTHPEASDKLVASISGNTWDQFNTFEEKNPSYNSHEGVLNHISELLVSLAAEERLPCIIFTFDEALCEQVTNRIYTDLLAWEEYYINTPQYREKKQKRAMERAHAEEQRKRAEAAAAALARRSRKEKDDDDKPEEDRIDEIEIFEELDHDPDFSFVDAERMDDEKIDQLYSDLELLRKLGHRKFATFKEYVKRGIAMHSEDCVRPHKVAVEVLFRRKHIKVVCSTASLALGIHMPCKSVIIAGDSPMLTSTQFRQMAGRAGRRGYDLLGNVVFLGVPETKVRSLLTASLPSIDGHNPQNPTMALRLALLHNATRWDTGKPAQFAASFLSKSLVGLGISLHSHKVIGQDYFGASAAQREIFEREMRVIHTRALGLYRLRFDLELLQREGLLQMNGAGGLHSGLAARYLYCNNPAQIALIVALRDGLVHRICRTTSDSSLARVRIQSLLVILISHTIAAQVLHRRVLSDPGAASSGLRVRLSLPDDPSVREEMRESLGGFARRTLDVYSSLAVAQATELERPSMLDPIPPHVDIDDPEFEEVKIGWQAAWNLPSEERAKLYQSAFLPETLPLSHISFEREDFEPASTSASSMVDCIKGSSVNYKARSPFAAMTGQDDSFVSVDDLVHNTRPGLYFDHDIVPVLPALTAALDGVSLGSTEPVLSAFAVDLLEMRFRDGETNNQFIHRIIEASGISYPQLYQMADTLCAAIEAFSHACKSTAWSQSAHDRESTKITDPVTFALSELFSTMFDRLSLMNERLRKVRVPPQLSRVICVVLCSLSYFHVAAYHKAPRVYEQEEAASSARQAPSDASP